jgi:mercuric ion transport protein
MTHLEIDLVYFDGCPHVDRARRHLAAALKSDARPWREWNLSDATTPERFRRYGSPTILVDGADVAGEAEAGAVGAMACRVAGAPSVAAIRSALDGVG